MVHQTGDAGLGKRFFPAAEFLFPRPDLVGSSRLASNRAHPDRRAAFGHALTDVSARRAYREIRAFGFGGRIEQTAKSRQCAIPRHRRRIARTRCRAAIRRACAIKSRRWIARVAARGMNLGTRRIIRIECANVMAGRVA